MFVSLLFTVALRTLLTTGLINTLSYILDLDRSKVSNTTATDYTELLAAALQEMRLKCIPFFFTFFFLGGFHLILRNKNLVLRSTS